MRFTRLRVDALHQGAEWMWITASEHMRLQNTSSCQGWAMARGLSPLQYNPTNELKDSVKCCQGEIMPKELRMY